MAVPYYYQDNTTTALTASFVAFSFGFGADEIQIYNDDATNGITVSFDGTNIHMTIPKSSNHKWDKLSKVGTIWLKYSGAAPTYRLHSWQNS